LTQPADELEIVIQSEDMAPFVRKDKNFFQANAYLQSTKSKQRTLSSHVRYVRDEKGVVAAAVFLFPRKTESGVPTISPDERPSTSPAKSKAQLCALLSNSRKWSTKTTQRLEHRAALRPSQSAFWLSSVFFFGKLNSSVKIRRVPRNRHRNFRHACHAPLHARSCCPAIKACQKQLLNSR
jgi:hypothetical protein